MTRWVIHEEEESSASEFAFFAIIVSIVVTVIGFVAAVFVAFVAVGLVWGIIVSLKNYISGVVTNGRHLGRTISQTWSNNVDSMQEFFDKAKYYDHILPSLIKPFLVMSGVGVIFFGTITMVPCIVIHAVFWVLLFPVLKSKKDK